MLRPWYFKIVSNFTRLTAREITYNNFETSLVVFMPNITTNHAITYTNRLAWCNNRLWLFFVLVDILFLSLLQSSHSSGSFSWRALFRVSYLWFMVILISFLIQGRLLLRTLICLSGASSCGPQCTVQITSISILSGMLSRYAGNAFNRETKSLLPLQTEILVSLQ